MKDIKQTIALLKLYKPQLTSQQFRTLCGQAKNGDTAGALKGLVKLTRGVSENAEKTYGNAEWSTAL